MENVSPTRSQQARAAGIAAELASLGPALPGTLIQRHVRCGKPGCRCHASPPVLHGPYWQWTRKTGGKTITRLVPDDQLDDYRQWLGNHRLLAPWSPSSKPSPWPLPTPTRGGNAGPQAPPTTPSKPPHNLANHNITCGCGTLNLWTRPRPAPVTAGHRQM